MQIKPYKKNAKVHPKKQIRQVANSIEEFGMNQQIVVDKQGVIIVGHGRYEALKLLGLEIKDEWVKVVDLTEEQAKSYRLADNKLNESDWEMDIVIEELKDLSEEFFDLTGFDSDLLIEPDDQDDEVPEVPEEPTAKLGDIYQLGKHRIICGDATNKESIDKLMKGEKAQMCFTDPPYNVDYTGGASKKRDGIENDNMSDEEFKKFLYEACSRITENCKGGIYICMSSSELGTLKKAFADAGGHWQGFIIWVKNSFTISRSDYQHTYEPILYGWADGIVNHYFSQDRDRPNVWEDLRKVKTEYKNGYTTIAFHGYKVRIKGEITGQIIKKKQRTDIWRYNKPSRSEEHPTMKPVALCSEAIQGSSRRGEIVLDTFLGSGSTLIATEKTGRICYGMELDPKYIDVIVKRYEDYTGDKAKKI